MLRIFTGKPGGGKSYHAFAHEVVEELRWGTRYVCTNLAVLDGNLADWFHRKEPEFVDLHKRLRILSEDEARKFWLHPRPGVDLPDTSDEDQKRGLFPELTDYPDVLFVIDEAHKFFDARAYQSEGHALTHVNSQHRKLNWELVFVTQFPELISKRIKGFAQEWHNCRNYGMERIFSVFRLPSRFMVKVTVREPSERQEDPGNYMWYAMDFDLAKCYDTMAGVGIKGRRKPEEKKVKGISIFWIVPAILALLALMYWAPDLLLKGFFSRETKSLQRQLEGGQVHSQPQPRQSQHEPMAGRIPYSVPVQSSVPVASPPPVTVRGYAVRGQKVNVFLSDGRTLTEQDRELEGVDRNGAIVSGRKLWMAVPELRKVDARPAPQIAPERTQNASSAVSAANGEAYRGEALFAPSPGIGALPTVPAKR